MSFFTDEERGELWRSVFSLLGKLYQDSMSAPALTYAWDSELKKIRRRRGLPRIRPAGNLLSGRERQTGVGK